MVIGIDASRALKKQRTGTEVHNAEIIKHLIKIDTKNTYRLYSSIEPTGDMLEATQEANKVDSDASVGVNAQKRIQWRVMPFPRGWTLFRLSLEMLINPPDVLFIPAHILPIIRPKKTLVMLHDIGFDHFPELYKWTDTFYHRYAVRFAKLFATAILTPSEFTRQDLHEKYAISLKKMTTVYHGFDPSKYRPKHKNEPSPRQEPFFYFVGRLEYKKNVKRMIEAFKLFKEKTGLPHKFLLAGRPAHGHEEIMQAHENLGQYKKDVEFLGYVSLDDSANYMRHAQAIVFPTLFEGFGIPVLEGYASGTPAITSNTTSLPEAAGDGAILVDPTNVQAIAGAMETLATDEKLRQDLIKKGHAHYKQFSWDRAAKETLAVIERIMK